MSNNFYDVLYSNFSVALNNTCIILENGKKYTYAELDQRSAQYANFLKAQGIKASDRVCVIAEKSFEVLCMYLGCLRSNIIYLPLNNAYKDQELDYFFKDAEPSLVVGSKAEDVTIARIARNNRIDHYYVLDQAGVGELIGEVDQQPFHFPTVTTGAHDTAVIIYTSGTTGKPKGAMLTHDNLTSNGLALRDYWGFTKHDVLLHMLPLFHVHGLFFSTHCAFLSASQMIFLPKLNINLALKYLPQSTVMMGVPTYYTRLLAENRFDKELVKNIRLFVSGSAPLLAQTFVEFEERTGHRILERYGMTETGINTSNPLEGDRIPGTVGFPLPGNELQIVDDQDNPLAVDQLGHILMRGNNIFTGYWRKQEKTQESFTNLGFFRTGDMGKVDPKGYLSIIGRAKDMIITGGLKVYPKEIEEALDQLHGVAASAVIGLPHNDFGESVNAVVVAKKDSAIDEHQIIALLKTQLANYKMPKRVFIVDSLPMNTMGKVQKNILREQLALPESTINKLQNKT